MKKKIALILLTSILSCLLAVGQEKNEEYLLNEGMSKFNVEAYSDAKDCYDKAIALNSSNAKAWYGKGLALNGMSDLAERETPPDSVAAESYYAEAIESLKKAIELAPLYAEAYSELGWSEVKVGLAEGNDEMYNAGLESIDKGIRINPKYSEAIVTKGLALFFKNDYKAALEIFNKAILVDPNNSNAWYDKGKALEKLDDEKGASEAFQRAAELDNQTI